MHLSLPGVYVVAQFKTGQDLHCAQADVDPVGWEEHYNMRWWACKQKQKLSSGQVQSEHIRSPLDSMSDAVVTVSPNRQYLGIVRPTTPATTGPESDRSDKSQQEQTD